MIWHRQFLRSTLLTSMLFFERAAFLPRPLPGVLLSASPAYRLPPLEGFQRMLFWPCSDRDADCLCAVDFVVFWFVDVYLLGGASTAPRSIFFRLPWHSIFPPFSISLSFFVFFPSAIAAGTYSVMSLLIILASMEIFPSNYTVVFSADLFTFWCFSSLDIRSSSVLNWYCRMKTPHPKTKMISRVDLNLM